MPQVLKAISQLSQKHGLAVANMFHAGDGNLHPLILYSANEPGIVERVKSLGSEILRVCVEVGGSISGEHGVGADKRCYLDWMFQPEDLDTMKLLRRAFDPLNHANPARSFPPQEPAGSQPNGRSRFPAGCRFIDQRSGGMAYDRLQKQVILVVVGFGRWPVQVQHSQVHGRWVAHYLACVCG